MANYPAFARARPAPGLRPLSAAGEGAGEPSSRFLERRYLAGGLMEIAEADVEF